MSKTKKSAYPKSIETYKNDPVFYEELTILKAQEKIAELMKNSNTSRTELAKSLKQSKAHVTELLSDGRNLTLRTFARICFHLKAEVDFYTHTIGTKDYVTQYSFKDSNELHHLMRLAKKSLGFERRSPTTDRLNSSADIMVKNDTLSGFSIEYNQIEASYQIDKRSLPDFKSIIEKYKAA